MKNGCKGYFLFFIVLITVASFSISWAEQSRPVLIVGDDFNYPPYSFVDDSGNPSGFNIDLAKAVADAMGYDVQFRLDEWNLIRQDLENGGIDFVPGMFNTQARSTLYDFSTKHSVSIGDIFTDASIELKKLSDLAGKTVVVQKGDVVGEYLQSLKIGIVLVEVPSVNEALKSVANGTYSYAGLLKIPGLYELENDSIEGVIAQNIPFEPQDYCMAVKKGNEDLLHILNGGLNIVKSTGDYQEIYDKWLGVYDEKTMVDMAKKSGIRIVIASIIVIILSIALILIYRKLQAKKHEIDDANKELDESIEELISVQDILLSQYDKQKSDKKS
ncbi:MAG TPA: transporter substrate-binding domain-containing protein [Fusibacter sp.]|nr:transporter substrate-binding domain-containing protein [Fusibacter sp.]